MGFGRTNVKSARKTVRTLDVIPGVTANQIAHCMKGRYLAAGDHRRNFPAAL
jgi:hypothetical protein